MSLRRVLAAALLTPALVTGCSGAMPQVAPPTSVDSASALAATTTSTTTRPPVSKLRCETIPMADVIAVGGLRGTPKLTEVIGEVAGCAWTDGTRRVQVQDQPAGAWFADSKGLDGAVERLGAGTSAAAKAEIVAARAEVTRGRRVADDHACAMFATLNRAMGSDIPVAQLTGLPAPARPIVTTPPVGSTTTGGPRPTTAPGAPGTAPARVTPGKPPTGTTAPAAASAGGKAVATPTAPAPQSGAARPGAASPPGAKQAGAAQPGAAKPVRPAAAPTSRDAPPMVVALPNASKPLAILAQQCRNGRFTSVLVAGPTLQVTPVAEQRQVRFMAQLATRPLG